MPEVGEVAMHFSPSPRNPEPHMKASGSHQTRRDIQAGARRCLAKTDRLGPIAGERIFLTYDITEDSGNLILFQYYGWKGPLRMTEVTHRTVQGNGSLWLK